MIKPPLNCRQRLKVEGKAYPRSNCSSCGSLAPNSKVCDAALEAQPEAQKGEPVARVSAVANGAKVDNREPIVRDLLES